MPSIASWNRRLPAVTVIAVILGASACTAAETAGPIRSGAASAAAQAPAPTSTGGANASRAAVPVMDDAWLVVGRVGEEGLHVILASTAESIYDLPAGVPDATWGRLVTATTDGATTRVQDAVVQPGGGGPSQALAGAWRLPTIGSDPMPAGVSADGRTIVLVPVAVKTGTGAGAPRAAESRFAIIDRTFVAKPRIITLPGAFDFDALSANGTVLYVIEHLAGPPEAHYQVRAVDLATGVLRDGAVVDKSNLDEAMGGYPIGQVRRSDGMVFTIYQGVEHPFIHALSTLDAWALCIDLPSVGADDAAAALDWGLAANADGGPMVAANATLGVAAQISNADLSIARMSSFAPAAAGETRITLAKFGHQAPGVTGRRAVIAPDGAIYLAGRGGVVRLSKTDLTVVGRLLEGTSVDALAVTPDGRTLFALTSSDGRIVKVDAATGTIVGTIPGTGYDRLVAVVPW
jgi:hypothetical protein